MVRVWESFGSGLVTTGVSQVLYRCFIGVLLVYRLVERGFNRNVIWMSGKVIINRIRSLAKQVVSMDID